MFDYNEQNVKYATEWNGKREPVEQAATPKEEGIPTPSEVRDRIRNTHTEEATAIIQALAKELRETRHVVGEVWISGRPIPVIVQEVIARMAQLGWVVRTVNTHLSQREGRATCWRYEPAPAPPEWNQ